MKKKQLLELLRSTQEALAALQASQSAQQVEDSRTLSDWMDVHEQQIKERGLKPQTIGNRMSCCRHIRRLWGDRTVRGLKAHEIASKLKSTFWPLKSSTGHRVLSELKDAYASAIANDWAEVNPASHVKLPTHRVQRKRLKLETWFAMFELAKALPVRWVPAMLLLSLVTGQRRADLAKMDFERDIVTDDAGARYLRVEQQKQAGKGYGARLEIPLDLRLQAVDMTVREVIEFCRCAGSPGPTMLRTAGGRSLELSSLSNRFAEVIRAVCGDGAYKPKTWPSLHECRSLSCRLYRAQGYTAEQVQTLLGHKDVAMTKIYEDDRGLNGATWKRVDLTPAMSAAPAVLDHDVDLIPVGTGLGLPHADQRIGVLGSESGAAVEAVA